MPSPRTLVSPTLVLEDEEDVLLYGMYLWILLPQAIGAILEMKPPLLDATYHRGVIGALLRREEILSLATLFPLPVPDSGGD